MKSWPASQAGAFLLACSLHNASGEADAFLRAPPAPEAGQLISLQALCAVPYPRYLLVQSYRTR